MTRRRAVGGTLILTGITSIAILMLAFGGFSAKRAESRPAKSSDVTGSVAAQTVALSEDAESPATLTGKETEDDHPALARGADGSVWLTYVEYKPAGPVAMEQVEQGQYESLVPQGNGDRIRLRRFDGKTWQPAIDVTDGGLDVWRPTVAVAGDGNVVIAWAQKADGNWDIYSRSYTPPKDAGSDGTWSKTTRVSNAPGTDLNVVSATDSAGTVWLAWQGFDDGHFKIQLKPLGRSEWHTFAAKGANCWRPALAADGRGNVYVAYDSYLYDNYDVSLATVRDGNIATQAITRSPKFEARVALACDANDRLWIAYEEGDEQWGKDYEGNTPEKVGIENLGFGLYVDRTVRVKCLEDGQLKQPTADLQKALQDPTPRARSVPRLAVDDGGGLWLLYRHHIKPGGGGEAWQSYATRFDGKSWSQPQGVPHSSNIIDNLPALVSQQDGLLAVYSSDTRTNTQSRDQDDLFATVLSGAAKASPPELTDVTPKFEKPTVEPVHPNEDEDVTRIRQYRVTHNGRELRLLRGEFHRHTEYTSHRDQDGLLEDSLRYALDSGRLDWMGNGDHDNGFGQEYMWWQIQKVFDMYYNPPYFTPAMTYERSVRYPSGHRNVMFPRRGIRPLPRLKGKDRLYGTADEGAPDIKMLYKYLKHFDAICAVHTSGTNMGTDWRDNDPDVEPVVEIYQAHRHNYEHFGAPRSATKETQIGGYQEAGFIWNALQKGYRLGFQSSSDHVGTHMSYAVVLTDDSSRKGLIEAFKKRHSYAATDNIILVVESGDHLMGDQFQTDQPPTLAITVQGTAPIDKVHVIRDNEYVHTEEPNEGQRQVNLRYTDTNAKPGESHYYYVRVEQDDRQKNLAWASPMWITYKP